MLRLQLWTIEYIGIYIHTHIHTYTYAIVWVYIALLCVGWDGNCVRTRTIERTLESFMQITKLWVLFNNTWFVCAFGLGVFVVCRIQFWKTNIYAPGIAHGSATNRIAFAEAECPHLHIHKKKCISPDPHSTYCSPWAELQMGSILRTHTCSFHTAKAGSMRAR